MYRIYTRTGDKGTTALFGGSRIDKDDIRVKAYGTVDELISQLGVCYASTRQAELRQDLHAIQKMLFVLGAELASDEKGLARLQRLTMRIFRRWSSLLTAIWRRAARSKSLSFRGKIWHRHSYTWRDPGAPAGADPHRDGQNADVTR
jgi:cob(I)alamin adenosyltransferase